MRLIETDEDGMVSPPEREIATSASGEPEKLQPLFGDSLNHLLKVQLTLVTTQVEDAVYRKQDQELELSFNFITPDFKLDSMADTMVEGTIFTFTCKNHKIEPSYMLKLSCESPKKWKFKIKIKFKLKINLI